MQAVEPWYINPAKNIVGPACPEKIVHSRKTAVQGDGRRAKNRSKQTFARHLSVSKSPIVIAISDINAPLPSHASIHAVMLRFPDDGSTRISTGSERKINQIKTEGEMREIQNTVKKLPHRLLFSGVATIRYGINYSCGFIICRIYSGGLIPNSSDSTFSYFL